VEVCIVFEMPVDEANKSFFSEIISSVSDVKFSHDGRYIMSRDYLTVKVREKTPPQGYDVSSMPTLVPYVDPDSCGTHAMNAGP
jgi:hypothetical protein